MPRKKTSRPSDGLNLSGFDAFVRRQLRDWDVPGAAIVIVENGEVVLMKGYGLRDKRKNLPVTPDTVFPIASVSKAFTAAALAMLVEEGKLDWDKPVREYMPEFALQDELASDRVTPRDLACHRTGVPRHDRLWYYTEFDRHELVRRVRHLPPSRDFRSYYQYNNLMYTTCGVLVGKLSGKSWEDFTRERILEPLGMNRTSFCIDDIRDLPDVARPYMKRNEKLREVPYKPLDGVTACGAINSSVNDMKEWLKLHMADGKVGRKQLISKQQMADMHTPHAVSPGSHKYVEIPMSAYGLGWSVAPYRGLMRVSHSGGIDGFSTRLSFCPEHRVGMVILTNRSGNPLPAIVELNLYDRMLGADTINWSRRFKKDAEEEQKTEKANKRKRAAERVKNTRPSHALKDYVGIYEHPGYGELRVERKGRQLVGSYGLLSAPMEHYHYDTFTVTDSHRDWELMINFTTDAKGKVDALKVRIEPTMEPQEFKRKAEPAA